MNKDTDYQIQALVDGELSPDQAKRIRDKIRQQRPLQARYEALLRQKSLLQRWWKSLN